MFPIIHAYAVSGALIASLATFAFLQFPGLLVWCAFIGWAGFLHSGGGKEVIPKVMACMALGISMCWLVALGVGAGVLPLPVPVAAALLVAAVTPVMIWLSRLPLFGVVPASFYGFATGFAYLAQTPDAFTVAAMTSASLKNVAIVVPISLLIGIGLGVLQTRMVAVLGPKADGAQAAA
ncbi:conserved membrane hypothetical protein [Rubrivivax sp. A210]|uniref:DUF1097 domain-containing protein n=1 Tax=Rubrivivax sp. A210 TaxID=2772301 RepID=UPI001918AF0E|nr:DUF1097 domain-containing protein [Rubrivivax sp. A210]CAD5372765.1 conserved membrane hypothetical protein [Rubrivivax sp. A210]